MEALSYLPSFHYCLIFLVVVSPVITNNSGVVDQVMGQNAIFKCIAVSQLVHITYWTFNGNPLSNSDKYLIQVCEYQNNYDDEYSYISIREVYKSWC